MNTEQAAVLEQLETFARRRGWTRTADFVEGLLARPKASLVPLAVGGTIETAPLESWMESVAPGALGERMLLEALVDDPRPALLADRVLIAFECGTVPESAALDALASVLSGRTPGSYSMVLVRADKVQTPEDLELVQRIAWRLLLPGPKPDWNNQRLADRAIYLWSDGPVVDFLSERLQSDIAALSDWLRTPSASDTPAMRKLDEQRVLSALDFAEAEALRFEDESSTQSKPAALSQVISTQDTLINLRRKVLGRVSSNASDLENTLLVALERFRQNLQDGLRSYLSQQPISALDVTGSGDGLQRILLDYITGRAQSWRYQATEALATWRRGQEGLHESLEEMDWFLINRLARQDIYPDAIFQRLSTFQGDLSVSETFLPSEHLAAMTAPPEGMSLGSMLRLLMAGSLATLIARLFGAGPLGMMTVGLTSLLAVGGIERGIHRARDREFYEAEGHETISRVVDSAERDIRAHLAEMIGRLRQVFQEEFDRLASLLEEARRDSAATPELSEQARADREFLEELRLRLEAGA